MRLPTGDEMNLLGTGATAVQPYAVWSASLGPFSPHVNAGYRWNGTSVLAGGPGSGESRDLPDVVRLQRRRRHRGAPAGDAGGGRARPGGARLAAAVAARRSAALDAARTPFPDIAFRKRTLHELSAATGFKVNIADRLLVNANLLFRLNSDGLRDKVSPLLGVEYAF